MYRINSISKQIVKLQVQQNGKLRDVTLMPNNFVFTEVVTSQMKNLQNSSVIRVREVARPVVPNSAQKGNTPATNDSKRDTRFAKKNNSASGEAQTGTK